jgi:hypothetical protein
MSAALGQHPVDAARPAGHAENHEHVAEQHGEFAMTKGSRHCRGPASIGLADPNLTAVLPAITAAKLDTWLVTHENLRGIPRVRAVFDTLVEAFEMITRVSGSVGVGAAP